MYNNLHFWFSDNSLYLNVPETKAVVSKTPQYHDQVLTKIKIGDSPIKLSDGVKFLGMYLYKDFRRILNAGAIFSYYFAKVQSRLDLYSHSMAKYYICPNCIFDAEKDVRVIADVPPFVSCCDLFKKFY